MSIHPEVQQEIDRISKWYADHYKIGLSVRDDMRHVVALAVEKGREEATKDAERFRWWLSKWAAGDEEIDELNALVWCGDPESWISAIDAVIAAGKGEK